MRSPTPRLPYVLHLAAVGVREAIAANPGLRLGVNVAGDT